MMMMMMMMIMTMMMIVENFYGHIAEEHDEEEQREDVHERRDHARDEPLAHRVRRLDRRLVKQRHRRLHAERGADRAGVEQRQQQSAVVGRVRHVDESRHGRLVAPDAHDERARGRRRVAGLFRRAKVRDAARVERRAVPRREAGVFGA